MATLRRSHTPVPWGARVEKTVWVRSQSGKPRRRRLDRPPLTYDPGWDWDGAQILFDEKSVSHDQEECDCGIWAWQSRDDVPHQIPSGRPHTTLSSLLDVAQREVTKKAGKARSGFNDFEVIRVPRVVPILEEEPDLEHLWEISEWEQLDSLSFKRTYSEVARGLIDEKGPPNNSRFALVGGEDDSWEYL